MGKKRKARAALMGGGPHGKERTGEAADLAGAAGLRARRPVARERADLLLVARGLAPSRERARAVIMAGEVFSGERRVDKASDLLPRDAPLEVRGRDHPYVSRGGVKLAGALDRFGVNTAGAVVLDVGASTGGFADCVLQRGARRVYAVDVGHGQLAAALRADARVVVLERLNARALDASHVPEEVDLVTIDVSFIGVEKVLGPAAARVRAGGRLVVLVKPQFELAAQDVGPGGVVADPALRARAADQVAAAAERLGLQVAARADSVLAGPQGNVEIFLLLEKP
ncbi:MAG TPA: TlyA family RNA methyltransferase [Myxococcota bacterium]|jgi:23S rRNA (cytidine1920-2'-O)/16S rRNA (cytidine1409-2'-O)-methyltransferase|nr:TlyA family RNA methyltransferase [Myxococcota bacterium]